MGLQASKQLTGITLRNCTLWKADRSPACRAVMMALDAVNLSVNEVDVNMDTAQHKAPDIAAVCDMNKAAMNSMKTLPILKDRQLILTDSHAISTYLITRYCNDGRLLPTDPGGRSLVDQTLYYNNGILMPKYRAAAYPILYEQCKYVLPQHINEIENSYKDLEKMLQHNAWFNTAGWPMLSDIFLCATLSTLNCMVPIDAKRFPKLSSWLVRMSEQLFYTTANTQGLAEFSRRIGELELLK